MVDHRWVAWKVATRIVASLASEGRCTTGPVAVGRSVIEEHIKEYTQKYGIPLDDRMERQLYKYGVMIQPSE